MAEKIKQKTQSAPRTRNAGPVKELRAFVREKHVKNQAARRPKGRPPKAGVAKTWLLKGAADLRKSAKERLLSDAPQDDVEARAASAGVKDSLHTVYTSGRVIRRAARPAVKPIRQTIDRYTRKALKTWADRAVSVSARRPVRLKPGPKLSDRSFSYARLPEAGTRPAGRYAVNRSAFRPARAAGGHLPKQRLSAFKAKPGPNLRADRFIGARPPAAGTRPIGRYGVRRPALRPARGAGGNFPKQRLSAFKAKPGPNLRAGRFPGPFSGARLQAQGLRPAGLPAAGAPRARAKKTAPAPSMRRLAPSGEPRTERAAGAHPAPAGGRSAKNAQGAGGKRSAQAAGKTQAPPGRPGRAPVKTKPKKTLPASRRKPSAAVKQKPIFQARRVSSSRAGAKTGAAAMKKRLAKRRLLAGKRFVMRKVLSPKPLVFLAKKLVMLLAAALKALAPVLLFAAGAVLLVCVVIGVVSIIASPFGLLFSKDAEEGAIPVNAAVNALTAQYNGRIDEIRASSGAEAVSISGPGMADMVSVLAAYAVVENQTADVVTMDEEKLETLKEVFWAIHTITWYVMNDDEEGVSTLFIELTHKGPEEIPDLFGWNASQESAFTALLSERALIAELISDDLSAAFSEVPYGGFSYAGSGLLLWPVPGRSHVSSEMGYRIHPVDGYRKLHTGMDIPAPTGTQVVAAADGLVVRAGWYGSYGNVVMIDHGSIGGEHLVTLYAHNSAVLVSAGDTVAAGDGISLIGSTGRSTGPHCHFEVRVGGAYQNPRGWL